MENYLYPFFWQHGETEEVISDYMDKISESGMKAACIEARPHPQFLKKDWWHDMEVIIRKAKEHDMKLWILDDSHFPTGYANGRIVKDYPQYKKLYLYKRRYDVVGPMKGARINAGILTGRPWEKQGLGDKNIVGIYLAKRAHDYTESDSNMDAVDADSMIELKGAFENNIITFDIPAGAYSVFVIFTTGEGGEEATEEYLNPLVAEAARVLIDEVYEPHYAHFKEEFGRTITAFFSDEPRFGNIKGPDAQIGKDMVLPWRPGLENEIPFEKKYLPLLWTNAGGAERGIRYQYMDLITRLYSENFSGVLAGWCREHGVCYVGHNIEDEGAHCRLGYGAGHYFRAQEMQDYAGVDVIGTQIVPGMPYHHDAFSTGGNNGEFYHYALAKLAASAAHLDAKKKGRAMCEAFGAYGWNEGLKMMKWLTDHLISRGITALVPHAFDPKEFPDWDCAPHFYAHGNNPQFRYFPVFTSYVNRLLALFNGGKTAAKAGVLYHAALEWYNGKCMPVEKVLRTLCENQIDADIISEDYLEDAVIQDKKFIINGVEFEILFVPEAEEIPADIEGKLRRLTDAGVIVVRIGSDAALSELTGMCGAIREVVPDKSFPELVYYHYRKNGQDILFFFNESVLETVDTMAAVPLVDGQNIYCYDAFSDSYMVPVMKNGKIRLKLAPYQSAVYILGRPETETGKIYTEGERKVTAYIPDTDEDSRQKETALQGSWNISYADAHAYPHFTEVVKNSAVIPLNAVDGYSDKAGTVSYERKVYKPETKGRIRLDLGMAYETVQVFLNGNPAGIKIVPPYEFDVTDLLRDGGNTLRIEVTNTLGTRVRDGMSQYLVIEPFGMTEVPKLIWN